MKDSEGFSLRGMISAWLWFINLSLYASQASPKEASSESIKTEASFIWELSLQREFWSIINFHEMKNFTGIYEVFVVSPLVC